MKFLNKLTLTKIAQYGIVLGLLFIMGTSTFTSNEKLIAKKGFKIINDTLTLNNDTLTVCIPANSVKSKKPLIIVVHLIK